MAPFPLDASLMVKDESLHFRFLFPIYFTSGGGGVEVKNKTMLKKLTIVAYSSVNFRIINS